MYAAGMEASATDKAKLLKFVRPGVIADLGCGTGTVMELLRRKFRKTERAAKIDMEVLNDISPHIDAIYPLYLQVHERSPMKFETLTKEFFVRIAKEMPERTRFFVWRTSDKIIAFSLGLVCGDTIYDECLGLDYDVALDLHLYFYTMRDVIRWAIDQKLRYY